MLPWDCPVGLRMGRLNLRLSSLNRPENQGFLIYIHSTPGFPSKDLRIEVWRAKSAVSQLHELGLFLFTRNMLTRAMIKIITIGSHQTACSTHILGSGFWILTTIEVWSE